ncbi:DUF4407 domain-containing protein [Tenacibaculum finnmarkense]|uniref:DUF4407 domain-containing protein n=1 Tax=Tenacibaculum finnmarkense TaxID=2781243 RepID=UPI001E3916F1|nr:DUF4407 domain-containing protein [Tenacibaculum finnmarkense]MCD8408802.1 DUF4407 domain-containing protein [Tenacibaculum finnmarkense genomovar ulcerans]MCD8421425.1 DUF4407 domain-containing protein [Tenacibaculum finnmarkense genomovar ulcerans]MCG8237557.1 DUF4407 domain-containing protein [Tenacibaculum finnmarkense genomovar ulcerans]
MKKLEKDSQNLTDSVLKLNPFKRFFVFSSGVNLSILKYCPEEVNKFASIGATIVLTAILAALSGGYAFNFAFDDVKISAFFGIFWGIVIYNLDRYIVMSIRKGNSEKISTIIKETDSTTRKSMIFDKISSSWSTFLMASPRIIIAIIIALTVSKPIELRLFNKTIEKELGSIEINDISGFETKFKEEISDLNEKIKQLNDNEANKKENIYANNPVYQNKRTESTENKSEIRKINTTVKTNENIIRKNKYLATGYKNVTKYNTDGTPYISKESYKFWTKNQLGREKYAENKTLKKRKSELYADQVIVKSELKEIENDFKENVEEITKNYNASRKPITELIANKNKSYLIDLADWKTKVRGSTDLLSRLQALGNITGKKEPDGSRNSAYWSSFLITLLFISLETAPVIVKLLTKRGPYEELLDRIEYEYFINQQEAISKMNSKVNTILEKIKEVSKLEGEIFVQVEQQKLDAELKSNELLLSNIAEKQAHLAKLSVDKWYEEEKTKIDLGVSHIVNE